MARKKLFEFLDDNNVKYVTITHASAYTAQQVAAMANIPGKELAKTVIVKIDDKLAMVVLPASYRVNLALLRETVGAQNVQLAGEDEFKDTFPDCEVGAMPPFGNLYGVDVFVAESLTDNQEIVFNACTHTELVRITFADFERLANPKVMRISYML